MNDNNNELENNRLFTRKIHRVCGIGCTKSLNLLCLLSASILKKIKITSTLSLAVQGCKEGVRVTMQKRTATNSEFTANTKADR